MLTLELLIFINVTYAPWQSIESGYAITTDYHGEIVPPGTLVTATAGTTDSSVEKVTFRWHFPNGSVAREIEASPLLTSPYPPPNVPQEVIDYENSTIIWYVQDDMVPNVVGDWGVQAFFQGNDGKDKSNVTDVIMIRAESFEAIPETPMGTIGAAATMIIALALFALKKKKAVRISHKF